MQLLLLAQLMNSWLLTEPHLPAEHLHFLPLLLTQKLFGQVAGGGATTGSGTLSPASGWGPLIPGACTLGSPEWAFHEARWHGKQKWCWSSVPELFQRHG